MNKVCKRCDILIENCGNRRKFCNDCQKIEHGLRMKEYRLRNLDSFREKEAIFRKENKDELKKYNAKYNKEHRKRQTMLSRKWCENNKEKRRLILKKYSKTEKGLIWSRKHNRTRRAIKSNIIETFTVIEWLEKVKETNGICPQCNNFVGVNCLCLDHIHPISKAEPGRIYNINDVQPLCKGCNSKKGDKI